MNSVQTMVFSTAFYPHRVLTYCQCCVLDITFSLYLRAVWPIKRATAVCRKSPLVVVNPLPYPRQVLKSRFVLVGVAVTAVLLVALSAMVLNNFPEGGMNFRHCFIFVPEFLVTFLYTRMPHVLLVQINVPYRYK